MGETRRHADRRPEYGDGNDGDIENGDAKLIHRSSPLRDLLASAVRSPLPARGLGRAIGRLETRHKV